MILYAMKVRTESGRCQSESQHGRKQETSSDLHKRRFLLYDTSGLCLTNLQMLKTYQWSQIAGSNARMSSSKGGKASYL